MLQFGIKIAEKFGLDCKLIKRGLFDEISGLVQRPKDMSLTNLKACELIGRKLGNVNEYLTKLMQQEKSEDYVLATGETHSIREFLDEAFKLIGIDNWSSYIKVDPRFIRPVEVSYLLGDAKKSHEKLGWKPKTSFTQLVKIMVENDIKLLSK
jgi:GDP-D-mannose dehydratase